MGLGQRVLIRHPRPPVRRTGVAERSGVVDLVVVVDLAVRPGRGGARHHPDRPPAGAAERAGQGEPVTRHQVAVALLAVDPESGQQGRVRQPAAAPGGRGGEIAAPRLPARCAESTGAVLQRRGHRRCDVGIGQRHPAVALHEDHQHLLAAQPGQQPVGGHVPEPVLSQLGGEAVSVDESLPDRFDLTDDLGRARGRRHRVRRHGADARGGAGDPEGGQSGEHREGGGGVTVEQASQSTAGPGGADQHRHHHQPGRGHHQDRDGAAERAVQQLPGSGQQSPVQDQVEGSGQGAVEADVDDLEDGQRPEREPEDGGHRAPGAGGQDEQQRPTENELHRYGGERSEIRPGQSVRQQQRADQHHQGDQVAEGRGVPYRSHRAIVSPADGSVAATSAATEPSAGGHQGTSAREQQQRTRAQEDQTRPAGVRQRAVAPSSGGGGASGSKVLTTSSSTAAPFTHPYEQIRSGAQRVKRAPATDQTLFTRPWCPSSALQPAARRSPPRSGAGRSGTR